MHWAASWGDRRGVAGYYTLGSGATLGGVDVGDIVGVGGSLGVRTRTGSGNTYPDFVVVQPELSWSVLAD